MIENREVQKGAFINVKGTVYQVEEVHVIIENNLLKVVTKVIGMDLASYFIQLDSSTKLGNVGNPMGWYVQQGEDYAVAYRRSQPDRDIHPDTFYNMKWSHTVHLINTQCFS